MGNVYKFRGSTCSRNGVASQTILPKVHSVFRISKLDVYDNPSKELQKVLTGTRTFNPFAGFSR